MTDTDKVMVKAKAMSAVAEFAEFIKKQNVIGLAVGVTVGGATTKLVSSLVENIINPIIGLFVKGGAPFSKFMIGPVKVGAFVNSLIDFMIIMVVVYIVINKTIELLTKPNVAKEEKK